MNDWFCTSCGHVGDRTVGTRGSFAVELVLWLLFIVPGLIYSLWRIASRGEDVCAHCRRPTLIPADSPVARQFLAEHPGQAVGTVDRASLAYAAGKAVRRLLK